MRPRKPIVLLMHSEIDLSLWRMRLETTGTYGQVKYRVLSALTLQDALAHLATNAVCYQVVTDCTCNDDLRQLQRRAGVKVLVINAHHSLHGDLGATAFEPKGPELSRARARPAAHPDGAQARAREVHKQRREEAARTRPRSHRPRHPTHAPGGNRSMSDDLQGFRVHYPDQQSSERLLACRDVPRGDARLANPFEDFEEVYPVAPVKQIELTPEIIAADAREQAERERLREASITWTPPVPYTRPAEPVPQLYHAITPQQRSNALHGSRIAARSRSRKLREQPTRPCAGGCGGFVRMQSKHGLCLGCFNAQHHPAAPKPMCKGTCGLPLRSSRTTGMCEFCHRNWKRTPEGKAWLRSIHKPLPAALPMEAAA